MARKQEQDQLDELVSLNFKITEGQRREFKVWCAERGMTQVDAFKKGFKLLKDNEYRKRS